MIHSSSWGANNYTYPLLGLAVPCFFTISGYFLFSGDSQKECAKSKKQLKKALCYLVFFSAIYGCFFMLYCGTRYVWQTPVLIFATGQGICAHLWYLAAMWQAMLLFRILRRFIHRFVFIIPILILLQAALHEAILLIWAPTHTFNLLFFAALCYILDGYVIHQYERQLTNTPSWIPAVLLIFCIMPYEAWGFLPENDLLFTTFFRALGSFSIVLFCIKHKDIGCRTLSCIGEKHSANIYFYHVLIVMLLSDSALKFFHLDISSYAAYLTYLLGIPFSYGIQVFSSAASRSFRNLQTTQNTHGA